jgi:sec-independent protein translocase protein TatB
MLPEVGATELLVIAAIALIVVGPKDLPVMLRKLGQFIGRMRDMASEFRASFDEMARQSELDELRREVEAMRAGRYIDPLQLTAEEAADAEADQVFADIHAGLTEPLDKPKRAPVKKKTAAKTAPKKPRARKKPEAKA